MDQKVLKYIKRPRNNVFGPNERGYFADFFCGLPPPFTGKIHQIAFERLPWISATKEFVHKDVPISEFIQELQSYWPKFIAHHNDAKWLDADWAAMKTKIPRKQYR